MILVPSLFTVIMMLRRRLKYLSVILLAIIGTLTIVRFYRSPETTVPASRFVFLEMLKEDGQFDPAVAFHNAIHGVPHTPLVVFSKSYCPHSERVKNILNSYMIAPPPRIIELDQHPNGPELQAYIHKVTGRRTVPNVVILGESRGGGDDMWALHNSDTLAPNFELWSEGLATVIRKE